MNKKISLSFLCGLVALLMISYSAEAQSTLEYSILTGAVGSAASKSKEEEQEKQGKGQVSDGRQRGIVDNAAIGLYGQSASVMSKGADMMSRIGSGVNIRGIDPGKPSDAGGALKKTKIIEFKNEDAQVNEAAQEPKASNDRSGDIVKLYLKNGSVIEGLLIERTDNYLKVESTGITITYFVEEISRLEEL